MIYKGQNGHIGGKEFGKITTKCYPRIAEKTMRDKGEG